MTYQEKKEMLDEDDNTTTLPAPPDGGYGWVIVVASFVCNMVVDGIAYTFGILLFELVKYYNESKGKTAWVGSLLTGTYLSVGPLVGALCNKFGCRAVCVAGSIISTAAFAISIFSPTVSWLMVIYGVIGGFGFGLIYLPAVVCVGYYFESKRSLATGIALCGSGVGTFAFAPLATFLLEKYGWKGTNLILAGIIFNCAIFGALMRPLEYPEKDTKINSKAFIRRSSSRSRVSSNDVRHRNESSYLTRNNHGENDTESLEFSSKTSLSSRKDHTIQPLARKDIFYSGSIQHLAQYQSHKSLTSYRQSIISIPHALSQDNISDSKCMPSMHELCDISLLKDFVFLLFGISNFFAMAGLYVPFIYLVDCARANGIPEGSASFLLSIMGITNTIGRIVCGYVADLPHVNSLFLNNICLIIAVLSVGAIPFCQTYLDYVGVAIFFSIAVAGFVSLSSIILVDLMGLDKLTNAFGLITFFRGAAALVGTPLAGALYDITQSYQLPFFVASSLFALAALMSSAAPFLRKKTKIQIDEDLNEENHII